MSTIVEQSFRNDHQQLLGLEQRQERLLIDLTLKAARKRVGRQTGFIHFSYEGLPGEVHETIPIFENACFALALFKSRLSEDIQEGKSLLVKLLGFENEGNFPVYLHEYPLCKDPFLSIRLLSIFLPLMRDFSAVLGEEILGKLSFVLGNIKKHAVKLKEEREVPRLMQAKIHALFNEEYDMRCWQPRSSKEWGEWLLAFSLFSTKELSNYLESLHSTWNSDLFLYEGVEMRPQQEKDQPAISLFDLFMSVHSGTVPKRFLHDHPLHLHAALLPVYPDWRVDSKKGHVSLRFYESQDLFCLLSWGSPECIHSLACLTQLAFRKQFDGRRLLFELDLPQEKATEEGFDISIYCSRNVSNHILVGGKRATTFRLNEPIEITSEKMVLKISYEQPEGEGSFFGHLSIANRPGQLACRGDMRFEAYDWLLGLRSVDRHSSCRLKMTIELHPAVDLPIEPSLAEKAWDCPQQLP